MNCSFQASRRRTTVTLLLCAMLLLSTLPLPAFAQAPAATEFRYEHDPRINPKAMADIEVNPEAVYGFSPRTDGGLAEYASLDWTDPEWVNGETGRQARIAYHESHQEMYVMLDEMRAEGKDIEEIARAVSAKRNELRLASYANDPEGLERVKARNKEEYGQEEGPLPEQLYEKLGSWELVLQSAFNTNPGMDACLGLYDDYYNFYVASGQLEDDRTAKASREYAIAAFVDAAGGFRLGTDGPSLSIFTDAGEVSTWFLPELEAAVAGGVTRGYEDQTLRPAGEISRIEALVILSRCLPVLDATQQAVSFTDVPDWARADVDRLSASGLVLGYGDGTLGATDLLTVEQVITLVRRAA